jgi:PhnB protein
VTHDHTSVSAVPAGMQSVTPWIISRDTASLIDFLARAFDAEELGRVENPDGTIGHAEVRIGDTQVALFDARPDWVDTPAFLRLYVAESDRVFARAIEAGATAITEMTELAFGDRIGRVRDPFGNLWWIMEHVADLTWEEMAERSAMPEFIRAMDYVQSADIIPKREVDAPRR